jgi:hypothetical protein
VKNPYPFERVYFRRAKKMKITEVRDKKHRFAKAENYAVGLDLMTAITELSHRALQGDKSALEWLLFTLKEGIAEIEILSEENTSFVREIARKYAQWPTVSSKHPEQGKANKKLLDEIQLGEESAISATKASRWNRENPANIWALDAIATIESARSWFSMWELMHKFFENTAEIPEWVTMTKCLPALSKKTAPRWSEVAKMAIREVHEVGHPDMEELGPDPLKAIDRAIKAIAASVPT